MEKKKQSWLLASVILNTVLAIAKLMWGIASRNSVLLADAVHSISDVISALVIYFAMRIAPHRSERFPLGLHKIEDLAAVIAGFGITYAGYEVASIAFNSHQVSQTISTSATIIFVIIMLIIQGVFWFYERAAAKTLNSPGVNADVANWLGDLGAGFVVLVGIIAAEFSIPFAEKIAVIVIAILIFHSAYEVIRDGLLSLLDGAVSKEDRRKAIRIIRGTSGVTSMYQLRMRRAGSALFLTAIFETNKTFFDQAHDLADKIEQKLHQAMPELEHVLLHFEPAKEVIKPENSYYLASSSKNPAETWAEVCSLEKISSNKDSFSLLKPDSKLSLQERLVVTVIEEEIDELYIGNLPASTGCFVIMKACKIRILAEKPPSL